VEPIRIPDALLFYADRLRLLSLARAQPALLFGDDQGALAGVLERQGLVLGRAADVGVYKLTQIPNDSEADLTARYVAQESANVTYEAHYRTLGRAPIGMVTAAQTELTSGVPFIMITLAFAQMVFFLFISLKAYGGDDGLMMRRRDVLPFFNARDDINYYYFCLGAATCWFVLTACIVRSRFGFVLSGLRQNERRMAAIGIAPYRYRLTAFIIAGAGAGLAGALMANYLRFVSPDMMHWTKSGELMMMVILGGAGTLTGPLLGAAVMVLLETVLAAQTENWQLYLGCILLAIVMLTRGGLAALFNHLPWARS